MAFIDQDGGDFWNNGDVDWYLGRGGLADIRASKGEAILRKDELKQNRGAIVVLNKEACSNASKSENVHDSREV